MKRIYVILIGIVGIVGSGLFVYDKLSNKENIEINDNNMFTILLNGEQVASLDADGLYNLVSYSCKNGSTLTWDVDSGTLSSSIITSGDSCTLHFEDAFTGSSFEYTGAVQTVSLPAGTYKLEVWGAQGGYRSSSTYGGLGGYSYGTLTLSSKTDVYVYVGGSGNTGGTSGGFNGGGIRYSYNGGGGASDIRIGTDSLYARVIVAGGGGSDGATSRGGGAGGGVNGIVPSTTSYGTCSSGYGTQTGVSGGTSYLATSKYTTSNPTTQASTYSGFGFGGAGPYRSSGYGGAGGGGWYGGGGNYPDGSADDDAGGRGGSGYVYTSSTASNYPSGCLLNSSYYLTDAATVAGNTSFTSPTGENETGHSGNGYAKISRVTS